MADRETNEIKEKIFHLSDNDLQDVYDFISETKKIRDAQKLKKVI
jgi:hypothetical protein